MFIYTIKASKLKFFAVLFLAFGILTLLIAAVPKDESLSEGVAVVNYSFENISTNDARVSFLEQFGYTVVKEPCEIVDVVIPEEFDSVYTEYNNIQREQGLNLKKYKGKTATRYTYILTGYPEHENEKVTANLLVYKSRIIGGDVCASGANSFLHGFKIPD